MLRFIGSIFSSTTEPNQTNSLSEIEKIIIAADKWEWGTVENLFTNFTNGISDADLEEILISKKLQDKPGLTKLILDYGIRSGRISHSKIEKFLDDAMRLKRPDRVEILSLHIKSFEMIEKLFEWAATYGHNQVFETLMCIFCNLLYSSARLNDIFKSAVFCDNLGIVRIFFYENNLASTIRFIKPKNKEYVLNWAIKKKYFDFEIVNSLVIYCLKDISPELIGDTLEIAAEKAKVDLVKKILHSHSIAEISMDYKSRALSKAVQAAFALSLEFFYMEDRLKPYNKTIEFLLERNVTIDPKIRKKFIRYAISTDQVLMLKYIFFPVLFDSRSINRAFMMTAYYSSHNALVFFLHHYPLTISSDSKGMALTLAMKNGNFQVAKTLLSDFDYDIDPKYKARCLQLASLYGPPEAIELLHKFASGISGKAKGNALRTAAEYGPSEVVYNLFRFYSSTIPKKSKKQALRRVATRNNEKEVSIFLDYFSEELSYKEAKKLLKITIKNKNYDLMKRFLKRTNPELANKLVSEFLDNGIIDRDFLEDHEQIVPFAPTLLLSYENHQASNCSSSAQTINKEVVIDVRP